MPITQMPNGKYVDVPDAITPQGLQRIQQQNTPSRAERVAAGQPRAPSAQDAINARADKFEKMGAGHGAVDSFISGITGGFSDRLGAAVSAGTKGVYRAVRDGDVGQIGDTYNEELGTQRELQRRYEEAHPVASTVGEIAGAVASPVGTGASALAGAGRLAGKAGISGAERVLAKGAAKLSTASPIVQGVAAGGVQGALNAAGHTENAADIPGAAVEGAGIGALTGGALGAVTHGAARGVQILRDRTPANAERTAYSRVAQMLSNGGTDAKKVASEISATDAAGGDAMVQDMTPGLRAQAGAISRKPGVPASNELIERGDQRIQDRRARFGEQVRQNADVPAAGSDALARGDQIQAGRDAAGKSDYAKGGVMDTSITPTPELQTYLRNAPDEVQSALKNGYREMLLRDETPADFVGPDGVFTHIPNLRTFDYVKRGFDTQIGQALKSGDRAGAQGLSYQLDKLKGVLADANPNDAGYKQILATQRDAFQKQNALDIGSGVLKRVGSEPRQVMRDLKELEPHQVDDARVGIIDALINSDNKADPVAYFRGLMRNDNQRKVMEFAFGGQDKLAGFEKWVGREVRATRADVLTAPGRQSETARFQLANEENESGVGSVLSNAMRGYAFGGAIGAGSGVVRTLQNIATGTTKLGQEEIAKILLSKGENLVKGTEAAQAFQKARRAGNVNRARTMSKAGQQIYTDEAGGN